MIYVTVGGYEGGFNRLVQSIDAIAPTFSEEIIIQKGGSSYIPRCAQYFDFISFPEAREYIRAAHLVVAHAGCGTILLALQYGVPLIIVPRRKHLKEHNTDHQMEICKALSMEPRPLLRVVEDTGSLKEAMLALLATKSSTDVASKPGRNAVMLAIDSFLKKEVL